MPKDWKTSIIVSLYKRGDKEMVGNYRGISTALGLQDIYGGNKKKDGRKGRRQEIIAGKPDWV